eukprot:sb/3461924/
MFFMHKTYNLQKRQELMAGAAYSFYNRRQAASVQYTPITFNITIPSNLLALFAPRDPLPYLPPPAPRHNNEESTLTGVGMYTSLFEDPADTPEPVKQPTKAERREEKRQEKIERHTLIVERGIARWDPHSDPNATGDAFKTVFVSRINYDTREEKLRREFEEYGYIRRIHMVRNKLDDKPRGYAFIEYETEKGMRGAFKYGDGKKIDGRRVVVDIERGRTVKNWKPRRLGGGLGGSRIGPPEVNITHSGRVDPKQYKEKLEKAEALRIKSLNPDPEDEDGEGERSPSRERSEKRRDDDDRGRRDDRRMVRNDNDSRSRGRSDDRKRDDRDDRRGRDDRGRDDRGRRDDDRGRRDDDRGRRDDDRGRRDDRDEDRKRRDRDDSDRYGDRKRDRRGGDDDRERDRKRRDRGDERSEEKGKDYDGLKVKSDDTGAPDQITLPLPGNYQITSEGYITKKFQGYGCIDKNTMFNFSCVQVESISRSYPLNCSTNLLALFAPRDPLPYLPPPAPRHNNEESTLTGVGMYTSLFEDPADTPEPVKQPTKAERREEKRQEKIERHTLIVERGIARWDPHSDPNATGDAFKTVFVSRINYDTREEKLRREFEEYGYIRRIHMVRNKLDDKPRGYAFIEYETEKGMRGAFKYGDGKKIDGRRVVVDIERGRTVKNWKPRRLGGGLGGSRIGPPEVNITHSGRVDPKQYKEKLEKAEALRIKSLNPDPEDEDGEGERSPSRERSEKRRDDDDRGRRDDRRMVRNDNDSRSRGRSDDRKRDDRDDRRGRDDRGRDDRGRRDDDRGRRDDDRGRRDDDRGRRDDRDEDRRRRDRDDSDRYGDRKRDRRGGDDDRERDRKRRDRGDERSEEKGKDYDGLRVKSDDTGAPDQVEIKAE